MERYEGQSVCEKIVIGKIYFYDRQAPPSEQALTVDAEEEIARFDAARRAALEELNALISEAEETVGEEQAEVFSAHCLLVMDPLYFDHVCEKIRDRGMNAESAVADAREHFTQMLLAVDDAYIQERASDVADVSERLMRLLGGGAQGTGPAEPSILAAQELSPSETVRFERSRVLAFVVKRASAASHMAILARARDIPAVLGVDVQKDWDGRMAVVDGCSGTVILDPDEECLARMREKQAEIERRDALREALRGKETATRSGKKIGLYANIGDASEVDDALANDAEGIGLFRSEFLFLQAQGWPTEQEQFETYRAVVCAMKGKRVVIRTLDVGADKRLPYLDTADRGIRVCLDRPEMFRTQLRAILRSAAYGKVAVMFPMIESVEELRACRRQIALAQSELIGEGLMFGDVEAGIMVETPEAVGCCRELAREADFFSVGTNDLASLLLGHDRVDAARDEFNDIVRGAVQTVIDGGHAAGIRVGICGELAADTALTETLVGMGIDELSVAPACVLKVREKIREIY